LKDFFTSSDVAETQNNKLHLDIKLSLQDCAIDYQPTGISSCMVAVMDKLDFWTRISTNPNQTENRYNLFIEGLAVLLHNNFTNDILQVSEGRIDTQLPKSDFGFVNDLKFLCFVQIASLNTLSITLSNREPIPGTYIDNQTILNNQQSSDNLYGSRIITKMLLSESEKDDLKKKMPLFKVEVNKGTFIIDLCSDSLTTLVDFIKHVSTSNESEEKQMIPTESHEEPKIISNLDSSRTVFNEQDGVILTANREQLESSNFLVGINDSEFGFSKPIGKMNAVTEGVATIPKNINISNTPPKTLPSSNNVPLLITRGERIYPNMEDERHKQKPKEESSTNSLSLSSYINMDFFGGKNKKTHKTIAPPIPKGSTTNYPENNTDFTEEENVTSIFSNGTGSLLMKSSKAQVGTLLSSFLQSQEYFPKVSEEDIGTNTQLPNVYPTPNFELVICNDVNVFFSLYGGNDWQSNDQNISDKLSSMGSISSYVKYDLIKSTRDFFKVVQLSLLDVFVQMDKFDRSLGSQFISRTVLSIGDVEIIDKVRASNRNKMLMIWESEQEPRETGSKMLDFKHEVVRQIPATSPNDTEVRIDIDILPLRFNLHQSTMEFLLEFFNDSNEEQPKPELEETITTKKDGTYYQHVHISPLKIKLDYQPVSVDLMAVRESGITSSRSLFQMLNVVPINGSEIIIKSIQLNGVPGIEEVISRSTDFILRSIGTSDVFGVLLGIMPLKSIYSIGTGVADLVMLPVQSYQSDGQVLRGLRRGLLSFVTNLSVGTVQLTANAANGVNYVVSSADEYLAPKQSSLKSALKLNYLDDDSCSFASDQATSSSQSSSDHTSSIDNLPTNINDAVQKAYKELALGLDNAKLAIIAIPTSGSVRSLPRVILAPLAGVTSAVSNLMVGIRSEIDSPYRKENENLFKK